MKHLFRSGIHSFGHIIHSSRASAWQKHEEPEVQEKEPDFVMLSEPVVEALGYIDLV